MGERIFLCERRVAAVTYLCCSGLMDDVAANTHRSDAGGAESPENDPCMAQYAGA
jgi:hypothetical protein